MRTKIFIWIFVMILLSLSVLATTPYPATNPFGAVLHYKLDDDCTDETGNYGCDLSNNCVYNVATPFDSGKSVKCSGGVDDIVDSNFDDIINGVPYSICFWYNETTFGETDAWFGARGAMIYESYTNGIHGYVFQSGGAAANQMIIDGDGTEDAIYGDNKWHHLCFIYGGGDATTMKFWIDGVIQTSDIDKNTGLATTKPSCDIYFMCSQNCGVGSTYNLDGYIDDILIFNDTALTQSQIITLNNSNYTIPSLDTINISSTFYPSNNTQYNFNSINFNGTLNSTYDFNVSLYINGTFNQSKNYGAGIAVAFDFDVIFPDGDYYFFFSAYNKTSFDENNENTTNHTFYIDTTSSIIEDNFINNTIYFNNNLTGQFNFTDNIMMHSINITIDNNHTANKWDLNVSFYSYNLSVNTSNLSIGKHTLGIRAADGHTDNVLGGDYDWRNGIFNDYLKFKFWDGGYVKLRAKDDSWFDEWTAERKTSKYGFTFEPSNPLSTQIFIVEAESKIYIKEKKGYYGDRWLIIGDHWLDFVNKDEPNAKISFKRLSDTSIEVIITNLKNPRKQIYSSIGDLNVVTKEYTFWVTNATETYESVIFNNIETEYNLTIDFGNLTFNISEITPQALLEFNHTNYTTSLMTFNTTNALFTRTIIPTELISLELNTVPHKWFYNISNLTNGHLSTDYQDQVILNLSINKCDDNHTFPVVNMTYFDEITGINISATNAYQLKIYDDLFYYNQTGSFTETQGIYINGLCTNLPPSNATYNWDLWGTFTLSKGGYITRIVDIDSSVPIPISNNPPANVSLFLIPTLNSSTVTYNWFTTNFELVDGTMRIYKCNSDGSQDLIESTPVIDGVAHANIQLLLTPYSYDIIIGGTIYTNPVGWTKCHTEASTSVTLFVDLGEVDVGNIIGLGGIFCSLNKTGVNRVKMKWGKNPEDTTTPLEGCIIAYRRTIKGNDKVYDNCTVEADFEREVTIPLNSNEYVITGQLRQGNLIVPCGSEVIFRPTDVAAGIYGISGLFAAFLLIIGLTLIYAGDGEIQLVAGGVGLILSWFLGVLNLPWIQVSAMLVFLIIVALIGRYTRKP